MPETSQDPINRKDALAVVVILGLWAAASLAVGPAGDFPLNDDWIYGAAVKSLLAGDGILLPGAVRGPTIANLLTQALWGAAFSLPAGFSYTALRLSTLVAGAAGLGFLFALLRENGVRRPVAITASVCNTILASAASQLRSVTSCIASAASSPTLRCTSLIELS